MSNASTLLLRLQKSLENITLGAAPKALKIAARAQLERVAGGNSADPDDAVTDALADAISELPGQLATHLDLLRLLHGEHVDQRSHHRANIAAALRDKARRLRRPLVESDFPPGHPVPLLALPYWGGVSTWSAGSARRAQRLKRHWTCPQNQVDALRLAAAQRPGRPVTHALLRRAGLHRLASVLDAEQLALLADEAGVDRALAYRPDGWWTPDRVINAYAEQCRAAGITLSSSSLTAIGGEASSLRIHATRHFGGFRAFQAAVVARHPDIRRPEQPVAADGTELDSWSEVVAFNAIRAALPDTQIAVHVVLPGEPSRSARSGDFLIDERVWVEVLGVARAAMPSATSARQKKYAAQWTAKLSRYAVLGITPVVIEPADIHDPRRLAERIGEIAQQLGVTPPPMPPQATRNIRAKGTWTFAALCQGVAEVARTTGMLPTHAALTAAGYGHAAELLKQPGERQRVATALGLNDPHGTNVWTQARVLDELACWVRVNGKLPTRAALRDAGHGALSRAIDRLWAVDRAGLHAAIEKLAGTSLPRRAASGSLATQEQLAAA